MNMKEKKKSDKNVKTKRKRGQGNKRNVIVYEVIEWHEKVKQRD